MEALHTVSVHAHTLKEILPVMFILAYSCWHCNFTRMPCISKDMYCPLCNPLAWFCSSMWDTSTSQWIAETWSSVQFPPFHAKNLLLFFKILIGTLYQFSDSVPSCWQKCGYEQKKGSYVWYRDKIADSLADLKQLHNDWLCSSENRKTEAYEWTDSADSSWPTTQREEVLPVLWKKHWVIWLDNKANLRWSSIVSQQLQMLKGGNPFSHNCVLSSFQNEGCFASGKKGGNYIMETCRPWIAINKQITSLMLKSL